MINLLSKKYRSLTRCLLIGCCLTSAIAQTATLEIDANKVENTLSPTLYGQFAEFMFEDIKGGLSAELIRDRGFDEQPNALGLPRYWERDPDDRNDDSALHFTWDVNTHLPNDYNQAPPNT